MYRNIKNEVNFARREEDILKVWKERQVHERCLEMNPDGENFVIYDGPPTANGKPHIGHVLTRAIKDLIPRYQRMLGKKVAFKAGWDTHGLPVELEVEKQLGIDGKEQIEAYGVEPFIKKCKENVFIYRSEWEKLSERVAYSADMKKPYATYENEYIESEWWALKQLWDKGMLYKGYKVVPYCPRCGTALSSHEVAQAYKDVREESVFVRFKSTEETDTYFAAWTTTPWTLPSNIALCVNPKAEYVKVRVGAEYYYLAKELLENVLPEYDEIISSHIGEDLVSKKYLPLFDFGNDILKEDGRPAHYIVCDDYVTMTDGTGIVHIAPAFGEDDARVARENNLPMLQLVKTDGTMSEECGKFSGIFCKEADKSIIEALREDGKLIFAKEYEHNYPHCWRCDTPLIYYARNSWFIAMTKVRQDLIDNNNTVNWRPDNVRTGRFGNFLENVVDWGLSRERYWGTPLPVWKCQDCGHMHCIGSIDELKSMSDDCPDEIELHKPYIDNVHIKCPKCSGSMKRETEVIDCWFDSGSMPFAQYHYPFENKDLFDKQFPADFISEAQDQTRGWFYSLMAISTQLFNKSPYENVICLGLVLDKDGAKMSKHIGNVVNPWEVVDSKGADALRWYFYSNSNPWLPSRISIDALEEGIRKYMSTLWNTLSFFTLYANIDDFDHTKYNMEDRSLSIIDKWILSRLESTLNIVSANLDQYLITQASRAMIDFVDDLSNWYVRRSRERYWGSEMTEDKISAYMTLYLCLDTMAKMTAPFTPFIAEDIYMALHEGKSDDSESVHLCSWPNFEGRYIDEKLEQAMGLTRDIVFLGRSARNSSQMKNRQALSRLIVADLESEKASLLDEGLIELIKDELNVKSVELEGRSDDLLDYRFKPQLKTLGKKLGSLLPAVRDALMNIDGIEAYKELKEKGGITLAISDETVYLEEEDLIIENKQREGFASQSQNNLTVALDLTLTEELIAEGYVRELISKVQHLRKSSGLEVTDHIALYIIVEEVLMKYLTDAKELICHEVLADKFELASMSSCSDDGYEDKDLNGSSCKIKLVKI